MPLPKTITYPQDAIDDFIKKPALKMIVFGEDQNLIEIADNLAQKAPTSLERGVLYITSGTTGPIPTALKLAIPELSQLDLSQVKAISVSTKNKIADKVLQGEPVDQVRIDHAYARAGLSEFN